uniref:DUF676 domain-containing protein n=1 Tax=Mesocestoides corti TaxID=53468 RepID=A0A5K3FFM5_MESCO
MLTLEDEFADYGRKGETVQKLLVAMAPSSAPLEAEESPMASNGLSSSETASPTTMSHRVTNNHQRGTDRIARRSLSQNFFTDLEPIVSEETSDKSSSNRRLNSAREQRTSASSVECLSHSASDRLVNTFAPGTMTFVMLKEHLKQQIIPKFTGNVYSDFSQLAVPFPYFSAPSVKPSGIHLVICVHGLDGNCYDLRLVTVYLQMALPDYPLEFLMSDSNHQDTFASFEQLRDNLVEEIIQHVDSMTETPTHISFIGHSLGCVLIRAALSSPRMEHLYPRLHTFLSFCGPHLGTVYSTSGLVSMGMWALQKFKKSESLLQLRMRDHPDLRETFMYTLSAAEGMNRFRYVLLVASPQDHYVPHHSSRIELCKASIQDPTEMGTIYMEMVANILQKLIKSGKTTVVRYDVHHEVQSSANHFIGRAAHVAVLDSEVFLEKFFCISAAKYFRCNEATENGYD